jgi:hypothetical protein
VTHYKRDWAKQIVNDFYEYFEMLSRLGVRSIFFSNLLFRICNPKIATISICKAFNIYIAFFALKMQIINSIGLQIRNSVGARLNMSGVPPALEED